MLAVAALRIYSHGRKKLLAATPRRSR